MATMRYFRKAENNSLLMAGDDDPFVRWGQARGYEEIDHVTYDLMVRTQPAIPAQAQKQPGKPNGKGKGNKRGG